jgi:hypothetical protein
LLDFSGKSCSVALCGSGALAVDASIMRGMRVAQGNLVQRSSEYKPRFETTMICDEDLTHACALLRACASSTGSRPKIVDVVIDGDVNASDLACRDLLLFRRRGRQ